MQQRQQIPVKRGMDLKAVATVLLDIGVDEARHNAFARERFA